MKKTYLKYPETIGEKIFTILAICGIVVLAILAVGYTFHLINPGYGR